MLVLQFFHIILFLKFLCFSDSIFAYFDSEKSIKPKGPMFIMGANESDEEDELIQLQTLNNNPDDCTTLQPDPDDCTTLQPDHNDYNTFEGHDDQLHFSNNLEKYKFALANFTNFSQIGTSIALEFLLANRYNSSENYSTLNENFLISSIIITSCIMFERIHKSLNICKNTYRNNFWDLILPIIFYSSLQTSIILTFYNQDFADNIDIFAPTFMILPIYMAIYFLTPKDS